MVADKVTMKSRKRRLSIQRNYVIAHDLQKKGRYPWRCDEFLVFGFDAWKQFCREFGPWVSSRFQLDAPGSMAVNENRQSCAVKFNSNQVTDRQKTSRLAVLQKCQRDGEPTHRPDLQPGSPTTMCNLACDETTELVRAGQHKSSVWGCGTRGLVATWQGRRRQEEPGRRQRCQDSENRRDPSVV